MDVAKIQRMAKTDTTALAEILEPFELTEQQIKYVLSGYAAFQDAETIFYEFQECFPEADAIFYDIAGEDAHARLMLAIRYLYPGHPKFPDEYKLMFSSLRRSYLGSIEEARLSSARVRLNIMEDTLTEIEAFKKEFPETLLECEKLKLNVLKAASTESYAFADAREGRSGLSPESIQEMVAQLSDVQLEQFKTRVKQGDNPDMILMDLREAALAPPTISVRGNEDETQETE